MGNKKLRKELNKLLPEDWEAGTYTLTGGDEFGDNIFNLKIYGKKPILKLQDKFLYEGDEYWLIDKVSNWTLQKNKLNSESVFTSRDNDEHRLELTKQDAVNYVLSEAKEYLGDKFCHFPDKTLNGVINKCDIIAHEDDDIGTHNRTLWMPDKGWIAEPVKEPTQNELLAKAKRDYPEGTIVIDAFDCEEEKCTGEYTITDNQIWSTDESVCIYYNGNWAKIIKKPILNLQDKFLYKGDDCFGILKYNNWKLIKESVSESHTNETNSCKDWERFGTKHDALNYVLAEAKERFEGEIINTKSGIKGHICNGVIYDSTGDEICEEKYWLWNPREGFNNNIKIIKEPKLMLGNNEVVIIPIATDLRNGELNQEVEVHCNGGQVTKQEWLEWFYLFMSTKNVFVYSRCYLSNYMVKYKKKPFELNIECIKNVTMEQIQSITDMLNEV